MHPQGIRACQPKRHKEEREREKACVRESERENKRLPGSLAPLFIFFSPPPRPALCKLS